MTPLVVDVGGSHVKILAAGQVEPRKFVSGPTMRPEEMVSHVRNLAAGWTFDCVALGYPGLVLKGRIAAEPHNLGPGWVGYDFESAFGCPVRIVNDAAMQALGAYRGGLMLFLGLGTGLGAALVADGVLIPMELAHLPYQRETYEHYLGRRGLEHLGKKKWRRQVAEQVGRLRDALHPDEVVLGGGNVKKLDKLPPGCRAGSNADAFAGGFRLWEEEDAPAPRSTPAPDLPPHFAPFHVVGSLPVRN